MFLIELRLVAVAEELFNCHLGIYHMNSHSLANPSLRCCTLQYILIPLHNSLFSVVLLNYLAYFYVLELELKSSIF